MGLGFFLKGLIIGLSLAIPVGIGFTWPIPLLFRNTKDSSTPTTPAMHFGWREREIHGMLRMNPLPFT